MMRPGLTWMVNALQCKQDDCLLWPFSVSSSGYPQFLAFGKLYRAHRYVCEKAHGLPPTPKHQAAHSCGNPKCVNPRHLSWKTARENQLDRERHGTAKRPGRRWTLTPQDVAEIRASRDKSTVLAGRYRVTEANIRQIRAGKIWKTGNYVTGGFTPETSRAARAKRFSQSSA